MASRMREVTAMVKVLVADHGCTAKRTKTNHWRITLPGRPPVTMASTPSDHHAIKNARADVRRYLGINL